MTLRRRVKGASGAFETVAGAAPPPLPCVTGPCHPRGHTDRQAASRGTMPYQQLTAPFSPIGYRLGLRNGSECGNVGQNIAISGCVSPRKYNRYGITDWRCETREIRPLFERWLSRPPPSTTRPSLRGDIWPEFARLYTSQTNQPASVTGCVTNATTWDTIRHTGDPRHCNARHVPQVGPTGSEVRRVR